MFDEADIKKKKKIPETGTQIKLLYKTYQK